MANLAHLTPNQRRHRAGRPWQRVRLVVLERDRWACQLRLPGCPGIDRHARPRTRQYGTVDHVVPLSVWPDQPLREDGAGLRAACTWCNTARHDGRHEIPSAPPSRQW